MNKSISMSIRVSEEELEKLKQAARLEAYSSYSEFVRRTALIKAEEVIKNKEKEQRVCAKHGKSNPFRRKRRKHH